MSRALEPEVRRSAHFWVVGGIALAASLLLIGFGASCFSDPGSSASPRRWRGVALIPGTGAVRARKGGAVHTRTRSALPEAAAAASTADGSSRDEGGTYVTSTDSGASFEPGRRLAGGAAAARRRASASPDGKPDVAYLIRGRAALPATLQESRARIALLLCSHDGTSASCVRTKWHPGILDADGAYTIQDLSAGEYSLQLALGDQPVSEVVRVSLTPDHPQGEADFRFAPTAQPSLTGTVTADDGTPIAGVRVCVEGELGTTTDASGSFRLDDLPDGVAVLWLRHPDYLADTVTVDPRQQPSIGCTLQRGASVTVHVTDAAGNPRAGVSVQLIPRTASPGALTDVKGSALFGGLKPGEAYTLRVVNAQVVNNVPPISLAVGERRTVEVMVP